MPTISIYLDERTYWKLSRLAIKEDITIAKAVQLIVRSYFDLLEGKKVEEWQKENTESSTKAT